MTGEAYKILRFMDGASKRFIIPVYQRNYDWRIDNCKQLYEDLIKVQRQNRKNHFFGSIVSVYNPEGHNDEYLIIDGQQRLTTLTLIFIAMHNIINKGLLIPESKTLGERILENYLIDKWQPQDMRIKLKPIKNDQLAFSHLFGDENEYIADSNLTINYQYFYDRILLNEISIDKLFDSLHKLEIISITLNNEDDPQLIFESLNSTGLDLSEGDKIRNYVLMGLPGRKQEELYDTYWSKIEKCTDFEVSSFIRDYLSIMQLSTPSMNNVYFKFKEFVEKQNYSDIEELLVDLLKYAKRYEMLLKGNTLYDKINNSIDRLNRIKTTVSRPFLMVALRLFEESILSSDELLTIFLTIENYIFRRNICDLPTNALNKIFLMLHNEISKLDESLDKYCEKFKYVLIEKIETSRFPDDAEFEKALSEKSIYNMRGESRIYIFERLENENTIETKNIWEHFDKGDYSIEHIMPQNLTTAWIDDLGDDYERIHHDWLHRLANLTISGYNSKYSNYRFTKKRDMEKGFKESGLRINQWIAEQEKWGLAELEERNELLIAKALKIWPYMETEYSPPEKQLDSASLDDDIDFTGKTIVKFSFMGFEVPVDSWTDMYEQVLVRLNTEDKSILTHLALIEDSHVELSLHFSNKSDSFIKSRQIDSNIYVYTNTHTQNKINVLRKIFELFNVDPTDLVFYLQNELDEYEDSIQRHTTRRKYWSFVLPTLREVTGLFKNVNPTKSNWLNGYPGFGGITIVCVANMDSARVELYLEMPDKLDNKKLFDYLHNKKSEIESNMGQELIWARNDEIKMSKIYLESNDVNLLDEKNWEGMAQFHVEKSKKLLDAFMEYLTEYFS